MATQRIRATQRDFDKLKKKLESIVVSCGGSFADTDGRRGIRSVYKLRNSEQILVWHRSYSSVNSIHAVKSNCRRLLRTLGVDSNANEMQLVRFTLPIDIEEQIGDLYRIIDDAVSGMPVDDEGVQ